MPLSTQCKPSLLTTRGSISWGAQANCTPRSGCVLVQACTDHLTAAQTLPSDPVAAPLAHGRAASLALRFGMPSSSLIRLAAQASGEAPATKRSALRMESAHPEVSRRIFSDSRALGGKFLSTRNPTDKYGNRSLIANVVIGRHNGSDRRQSDHWVGAHGHISRFEPDHVIRKTDYSATPLVIRDEQRTQIDDNRVVDGSVIRFTHSAGASVLIVANSSFLNTHSMSPEIDAEASP